MKVFIALVLGWSAIFVLILVLVGGHAAPCPELRPVGPPGVDREAIARMCEERDRLEHPPDIVTALQPWSSVGLWLLGVAASGLVARQASRRAA